MITQIIGWSCLVMGGWFIARGLVFSIAWKNVPIEAQVAAWKIAALFLIAAAICFK